MPTDGDIDRAGQMLWYRWQGSWDWSPKDFPNYRPVNNWSSWEWLQDSRGNQAIVFFWTEAVPTPERYPYSEEPVWWYGSNECTGESDAHEPSFPEAYPDGNRPAPDCNLVDQCEHVQGWHALKREFQILFYDPSELGEVARGQEKAVECASLCSNRGSRLVPATMSLWWSPRLNSSSNPEGSAFDKANGLLYLAQGGSDPVIHVLQLS